MKFGQFSRRHIHTRIHTWASERARLHPQHTIDATKIEVKTQSGCCKYGFVTHFESFQYTRNTMFQRHLLCSLLVRLNYDLMGFKLKRFTRNGLIWLKLITRIIQTFTSVEWNEGASSECRVYVVRIDEYLTCG